MTTTTLNRPTRCIAPKPSLAGYKIHGCRCDDCTRASTAYNNRRDRLIAYGRWQPMVDAEPIRQHIRNLMAADIGWQRVAKAAGVSTGGVSRILYGGNGRGPCKRVKKATADAILAVRPQPEMRSLDSTIDATGTRRRTQALIALGWSLTAQATRLGRTIQNHKYVLTTDRVTIRTARMVQKLYDELSVQVPEPSFAVTRTKRWAQRNNWAPPLAWDEGAIDDPNAQPNLGEPTTATDDFDPITVGQAVDGDLTYEQLAAHRPDVVETVRRLAAGRSDTDIAHFLRWPGRYDLRADGISRAARTIEKLRRDHGIPGRRQAPSIAPRIRRRTAQAA